MTGRPERGRGRARGQQAARAGAPPPAAGPGPGPGGPPAQRPGPPRPPPRPAPSSAPASSDAASKGAIPRTMQPPTTVMSKLSLGRGAGEPCSERGNGNGNGNGNGDGNGKNGNGKGLKGVMPPSASRGALRGRRKIQANEMVVTTRPPNLATKQGTSGTKVELKSNYFQLLTYTNWVLYQYRVDFNIDEDRSRVLNGWLWEHRERLGGGYIFDGTLMYSTQRLTQNDEVLQLTSIRRTDNMPVQISIRLVGQLQEGHIGYLQFFNIVLRRCLASLNLQLVQRNYYDPAAKIAIPRFFLQMWPGYQTSMRQHERDILLCAEITFKVMRDDTALSILKACDRTQLTRQFPAAIIGSVVLTTYNNKTYRIDDVDFGTNPTSTFLDKKANKHVSFIEYYKNRYGITIQDRLQPLLVSKSTSRGLKGEEKHCLLVPELCNLTGLEDSMRANQQLMRAVADHTRVNPKDRMERLYRFNERLQTTPEAARQLQQFNLTLSRDLVTVPGRTLQYEEISLGRGVNVSSCMGRSVDWTRAFRDKSMYYSENLHDWVVIVPERMRRETEDFIRLLIKAAQGMSFTLGNPQIYECQNDRAGPYVDAVEKVMATKKPGLILFIVPNVREDRYQAIKKSTCLDRPVPSQVVTGKSMGHKDVMSIATKIAIQINAKIGGTPWNVHIPAKDIMIVGFDVCHDSNKKTDSFGATVVSLDNTMRNWYSSVTRHGNGEELSNHLTLEIAKAIRCFSNKSNGSLPGRIVVYRDGVGEGQVDYVVQHEVENIKTELANIYGSAPVKFTYIIVTKRINTRFFLNKDNPPPGTVIDDVVTLPERYDFFLISQSVRQGSVGPTSYNIVSDSSGLSPDNLQRLTYKLTHLYYNWSGTIRVPAPCQYAHKLAFLVGKSLHAPPSPVLSDKLFFL